MRLALDSVAQPGVPVAGVGHSIGATILLGLVGGQLWMRAGQCISIPPEARMDRLVLLAPATDFFQGPGSLDAVRTPILAWAGSSDVLTPPERVKLLEQVLGTRVPVEVRVVEGAGHFSFMDVPPPQTTEPLPDRNAFLAELHSEVCHFVAR
jgi:alpha-beta hydrolase superfamily lysophospholipase